MFFCFCFVLFDYPNMHATEGSSSTRHVREVGHASHRRESIPNGWRRKVLFWGVGVAGDVVLMSSLSWNRSMSKRMMRWTLSSSGKWRRRSFRRSLRQWRRIWKTRSRDEGGWGRSVWWTLNHLMATLVAHATLAWCGSTMCTWPGRRLMACNLLILNLL